jgi:glycosyltransferase involved in cell wall biosynthesis
MLAHHFPPTGGSGSNRALAFTRYLPEHGWRPIVITPGVAWALNHDDGLLGEVPPEARVIRTRSFEARPEAVRGADDTHSPARVGAVPRWKASLGHLKRFPDAHIGWLPFALAAARCEPYDVAYSSSGPFTSHLVGWLLKRLTHKPWVAELRDGWYRWNRAIFPDYPAWRDGLERRLEAATLRTADRVVLVTERMAEAFRHQYADLPADHFAVVSNGYDPRQFEESDSLAARQPGWRVLHAGALYYGRSLAAFAEAARRLMSTNAAFGRDFRLTLLGTLDATARAELARAGLEHHLEVRSQVEHCSAVAAMRGADALLLIANTTPGAEATVPGKLFEYLAAGRPIVAVAPPGSSTADVLDRTGGGWLAPAGDPDGIAHALRQAYTQRGYRLRPGALAPFDRRTLAGDLAAVFCRVTTDAIRRF